MTYTISNTDEDLYKIESALRISFNSFQIKSSHMDLPELLKKAFDLKREISYGSLKEAYLDTHSPDPFAILELWEKKNAHLKKYTPEVDHNDLISFASQDGDLVITEHDLTVSLGSLLILIKYIGEHSK